MIFEDCKNCTKNKFNKYDTVINFVENKIGCIEKCVGCRSEKNIVKRNGRGKRND